MFDLLMLTGVKAIGTRLDEDGKLIIIATANLPEPDSCPNCGNSVVYKHGARTYQYVDTPMHGKAVAIEIERRRYRCPACGTVITPELPDLDDKRIATKRLVSYVQDRCFNATFNAIANETGLLLNTVKGITLDYAQWLEMNRNRVTPRILGIDEVMIGGEYRAVMTNLEMKTIYDIQEKRTLASLTKFFQAIPDRDSIEWIAADMWGPYKSLFKTQAPQAKFVIDKFHVVRMASEALEQIRKSLQKTLTQEEALLIKKNIRWSLLKGKNKRNDADWEIIEHIRQYHPRLAVAFDLKESFYAIYDNDTRQDAETAFKDWELSIPLEYKKEFGGVAKTVNNHHQDIFNYFDCPITNAYTEAFNGLLQVVNRMGRGYSYEVLRAKLMFSKVAMQSGQIVGTREIPQDKSLHEYSTSAAIKPSDYGAHIPTLNAISEREDLD